MLILGWRFYIGSTRHQRCHAPGVFFFILSREDPSTRERLFLQFRWSLSSGSCTTDMTSRLFLLQLHPGMHPCSYPPFFSSWVELAFSRIEASVPVSCQPLQTLHTTCASRIRAFGQILRYLPRMIGNRFGWLHNHEFFVFP